MLKLIWACIMRLNGIIAAVVIAVTCGSLSATAKASDYEYIGKEATTRYAECITGAGEDLPLYAYYNVHVRPEHVMCADIVARDLALKYHEEGGYRLIRDGEVE